MGSDQDSSEASSEFDSDLMFDSLVSVTFKNPPCTGGFFLFLTTDCMYSSLDFPVSTQPSFPLRPPLLTVIDLPPCAKDGAAHRAYFSVLF
jgi:hypothetical protein